MKIKTMFASVLCFVLFAQVVCGDEISDGIQCLIDRANAIYAKDYAEAGRDAVPLAKRNSNAYLTGVQHWNLAVQQYALGERDKAIADDLLGNPAGTAAAWYRSASNSYKGADAWFKSAGNYFCEAGSEM